MAAPDPLPLFGNPTGRPAASPPRKLALWRGPDSLRQSIAALLLGVLFLGAAGAWTTRWMLSARVHDYAILNLAGQLREIANGMALDGQLLLMDRGAPPSEEEVARWGAKLASQAAQYDRIVESFFARELSPDLTGLEAPVSCNWDSPSLNQLAVTRTRWLAVRERIAAALRSPADTTAALGAARVLVNEGPALLESSRMLAGSFKTMMQVKLDRVIALQLASLAGALGLGLMLWAWMRRHVIAPLAALEGSATRVLQGELGRQSPVIGGAETRAVAVAINALSSRMDVLFRLAERSGAGLSTAETLREMLGALVPVVGLQGIAIVRRQSNAEGPRWSVLRSAVHGGAAPGLFSALTEGRALSCATSASGALADLDLHAREHGVNEWLGVVLREDAAEGWIVAFAWHDIGGEQDLIEPLLRATATLLRAQLERTLSSDALVVAAVEGLAKLAESRDPETGDHLLRMSRYSALIAEALAGEPAYAGTINARWIEDLERFAPMHDIGKVGIADRILLKPGRLTDEERAEMSLHPIIGAEVLRRCEAPMAERGRSVFQLGIEIAEAHHEKWDGSGYPRALTGTAIPLSARIVALADVFDALTSRRPYKEAWSVDRALETIRADSGRHFDPAVVAALERSLPQVLAFYERHKHV
jgi:HD-GYP domain-containing protein (c-di-GMP phosphodiesterase class II)